MFFIDDDESKLFERRKYRTARSDNNARTTGMNFVPFIVAFALRQMAVQDSNAILDFSEAIKINPRDARVYEQRAAVEMKITDYDKALADYSEAIKLNPNEMRDYLYRAYIYEIKGDIKNSMADTDRVLKLDRKNQQALSRKQRLQARQQSQAAPSLAPQSSPPAVPARTP